MRKTTDWGMVKPQIRKEKWYKCHRIKNMSVGNQRGNIIKLSTTALGSLEAPK